MNLNYLQLLHYTLPLLGFAPQNTSKENILTLSQIAQYLGIALAIVGITLLVIVEFIYKKKFSRGMYHWLLLLGLLLIPLGSIASTSYVVVEETKKLNSCASCHVMKPFVQDLTNPHSPTLAARHYRYKWIAKDQCYACHTTYGLHGSLASKRDGFRHWLLYITNSYNKPIQYTGTYPNSNCLTCHENTQKFQSVPSHQSLLPDLKKNLVNCFTCHGPPHPLPQQRLVKTEKQN
ncbi:MAG: hypothetical protein D6805_01645 [Planctomycetota bacterium]|nr:MAG: hypothetical protein D6805_01645 [Planctomycetota bacterium]